jgi:hypothetical protein
MRLETFIALTGAAVTLTNLLNAWMTSRVREEITKLKLDTSVQREKDREWMEEAYIPRRELEPRLRMIAQGAE